MSKINIAIDGYAGCGKSTLARDLAKALEYVFVDSGAMYRGIALFLIDSRVDISNSTSVEETLEKQSPQLKFVEGSNHLLLDDRDVEARIRGEEAIIDSVSDVAAIPAVRSYLKELQQSFVAQKGVVMEGRDIGTVIMPEAELKIFITAEMTERVKRRSEDLKERGKSMSDEAIRNNLRERDEKDASRKEAPLRKAGDAVALDTTTLDRGGQLDVALALAQPLIRPAELLPFIQ